MFLLFLDGPVTPYSHVRRTNKVRRFRRETCTGYGHGLFGFSHFSGVPSAPLQVSRFFFAFLGGHATRAAFLCPHIESSWQRETTLYIAHRHLCAEGRGSKGKPWPEACRRSKFLFKAKQTIPGNLHSAGDCAFFLEVGVAGGLLAGLAWSCSEGLPFDAPIKQEPQQEKLFQISTNHARTIGLAIDCVESACVCVYSYRALKMCEVSHPLSAHA